MVLAQRRKIVPRNETVQARAVGVIPRAPFGHPMACQRGDDYFIVVGENGQAVPHGPDSLRPEAAVNALPVTDGKGGLPKLDQAAGGEQRGREVVHPAFAVRRNPAHGDVIVGVPVRGAFLAR